MAGPVRNVETGTVTALAMTRQNAPRPPNAWILYRSDRLKELPPLAQGERRAQADVSRMISRMWKNETDETRQHYERLADEKKAEHSIKYPGYRFQPMKKEERVALREQKKMVKDAERKSRQQQRGRASQQPPTLPPTSHSTPEPQALQVPPLYIQHSHLYPPIPSGSIYYPIELFGPAGPSPPVSLASSPAPESSPESTTTSDESYETTSSHPPSVAATPAVGLATLLPPLDSHVTQTLSSSIVPSPAIPSGGNPYLALFGPAATRTNYSTSPQSAVPVSIPNFASPVVPTPIPTPSPNPGLISSTLHLQSNAYAASPLGHMHSQPAVDHDGQSTGGINSLAQAGSTSQPATPDNGQMNAATLSSSLTATADVPSEAYAFDDQAFTAFNLSMNSEFLDSMRALTEPDSYGRQCVDAWNLGADIFTMPDLDPSQLVALPEGPLEVSIGDFNDFDLGAYGNPGMLDLSLNTSFVDQNDTSNGEVAPDILELLQGNFLASENDPPAAAAPEPAQPIPLSNTQVALSVDLSNTENCQKSSTPYVPPSGAAFASSRRVGGRWKPPPSLANEGSFENSSPCNPTTGPFL